MFAKNLAGRRAVAGIAAVALVTTLGVAGTSVASANSPTPTNGKTLSLSKDTYQDRIFAMWQAENIANWTGLTTENQRPRSNTDCSSGVISACEFFTDADWGVALGRSNQTVGWVVQDVFGGDDDTDIEYAYLHEMANEAGSAYLTAEQVAHVWNTYISRSVWFSDSAADLLMERGVLPPSSSLSSANQYRNIIDVNLVVESIGAYTPGRPDIGLQLAQLPIRAVAGGFTTHAGQFEVALYALASVVPTTLSGEQQMKWLIDNAKVYLPPESRATEIINWVENEYFNNPTATWEGLRDKIYYRYQANATQNGFYYIRNVESMINLGAQVAQLLWSKGDLTDAIRIGSLWGYDSDNPTASNAGLIGLMKGSQYVANEFAEIANAAPGSANYYAGPVAGHSGNLQTRDELMANLKNLPQRYNVFRTRDNLPDYLPDDPNASDTFTLMAKRSMPVVDSGVEASGGTVSSTGYRIPLVDAPTSSDYLDLAKVNPDVDIYATSANNQVRAAGGTVTVATNLVGDTGLYKTWPTCAIPTYTSGRMAPTPVAGDDPALIADGFDQDTRGLEEAPPRLTLVNPTGYYRMPFFAGSSGAAAPQVTISYDRTVSAGSVRLIGGATNIAADYTCSTPPAAVGAVGGWITAATVEVRGADGTWSAVSAEASRAINPDEPFQQVDLVFEKTVEITGVRVTMTPQTDHVNIAEIDVMAPSLLAANGLDPQEESYRTVVTAQTDVVAGRTAAYLGSGFKAGEKVRVTLESASATVMADAEGIIKGSITAPAKAGTYALQALGESSKTAATATVTVVAAPKIPAPVKTLPSATLSLSSASSPYGKAVKLTAIVSSGTGRVRFFDGDKVLGEATLAFGKATLSVKNLAVGGHAITVSYLGDASTYAVNTSAKLLTVKKASPSKVTVSASKFKKRTKPTIKVTVGKLDNGNQPVGKVTVYVGGKAVKKVNLSSSKKGKLTIKLSKKYSKAITVKAKFTPTDTKKVTSKTSKSVKVKVK